MVISSCSLAEARLLLDNFLKASIDKVGAAWLPAGGPGHSRLCDRQAWLLRPASPTGAGTPPPLPVPGSQWEAGWWHTEPVACCVAFTRGHV